MRLIIDTHIFLWALSDPKRISKDKLAEIEIQGDGYRRAERIGKGYVKGI
jgi:PIN domain nuclease of toxin-antitoxin system